MNSKLSRFLREEWLQLLLATLPLLAALAAMPFATERVPMQWGLHGQVNWTAPKGWGLLLLPGTTLLTYALVYWFENRDLARHREADGSLTAHGKATRSMRLGIAMVFGGFTLVQIAYALGRHPDVTRLVPTLVALLLAFLGNFFGKLKPNRYVGIRVPWTLNSETVWRHTHRISGWLYTSSSLLMLIVIWLLPGSALPAAYLAWIFVLVVLPLAIAWQAARRERTAGSAGR